MDAALIAVLGVVSALVGGAGVWTYLSTRRQSSGTIATSEAADLWAASKEYQIRMDAEIEKLRAHTKQLDDDWRTADRVRIECERRLAILEASSTAAVIIKAAEEQAAVIRAEAAKQRVIVTDAAAVAKDELKNE